MSSHCRKQHFHFYLDGLISGFAKPLKYARQPFLRLIHSVRAKSQMLVPYKERGCNDSDNWARIIRACLRMANLCHLWHGQPEVWTAPDASPFVQFRSFVSNLFAKYPVPNFMAPVWLVDDHEMWMIDLYLHLATGRSIRQFGLLNSFRITKRMACCLMTAPDDLHPVHGLRWAQVRSLGGDERLARLLSTTTILCSATQDETFWESVICFFVKNQPICADEVTGIVQFLFQQRFCAAQDVAGVDGETRPLQPEFTLEGRSLMSLRRHMANWRDDLGITQPPSDSSNPCWEKTAIRPFQISRSDGIWTIDEVLTGKDLKVEGRIMRHCVASYLNSCLRHDTSIWSMKWIQAGRRQRVLTIEVAPETRTIRQAKGKHNSTPTDSGLDVLQRWAEQEGLTLSERI